MTILQVHRVLLILFKHLYLFGRTYKFWFPNFRKQRGKWGKVDFIQTVEGCSKLSGDEVSGWILKFQRDRPAAESPWIHTRDGVVSSEEHTCALTGISLLSKHRICWKQMVTRERGSLWKIESLCRASQRCQITPSYKKGERYIQNVCHKAIKGWSDEV